MEVHTQIVLALSLICLYLNGLTLAGGDNACFEKITAEDKKAWMTTMETCKKKLNLDDFPKPDEVEKNGFDDKCFSKCKLMEMKIINDKGVLDTKTLEEFLKKVSPDKQADVLSLWQTCSESTNKTMEGEGGVNEKTACKAAAILKHCFMQGIKKLAERTFSETNLSST